MSKEYPASTILDIARIPEDRFDAFMEEFPLMVAIVRGAIKTQEELATAAGVEIPPEELEKLVTKLVWTDDDPW